MTRRASLTRVLRPAAIGLAAVLCLVPLSAAVATTAPLGTAERLLTDVLPQLHLAQDLGAAAPSAPMSLVVALAHPNAAAEQSLYQSMYDPASPAYHVFLTPAEYDARFGVAGSVVAATTAWLRRAGMRILDVSGAGDLVTVSGTATQVAHLFHTPIRSYRYQGTDFLANTAAISVPAALPIATVLGLNTLQRLVPDASPQQGATFDGEFVPQDLWKIYDMPAANIGQGQSVAIFGDGNADPVIADLRVFEQRAGLRAVPVRVVHPGPGPFGAVADDVEWNLDGEAATGMAPGVSQLVYYFPGNNTDADAVLGFAAWANDPNGPLQASASFGECEDNPLNPLLDNPALANPNTGTGIIIGDGMEVATEPILRQATMEGRTLFTGSGDLGAYCPAVALPIVGAGNGVLPGLVPFQNYPCVSWYAVCVGGTVLTSNAAKTQRVSETNWTYGGGGPSKFVAEPAFQKGIAAVNQTCLSTPQGGSYPPGTRCRGVPDIAADSSGGIPLVTQTATYSVVEDMISGAEGGTSLSSPLSLGMWARIQAAAPAKGLGFADESFYRLAKGPSYQRDFYDVTASEFGLGNLGYQPKPGWDYTTGLGVMDVTHLMQDLDDRVTPRRPLAAAAPPGPLSCSVVMTSPVGNAIDPISGANDPALDFTSGRFALTPDHKALIVSMSGPQLSPGLVLTSSAGTTFIVYWTERGKTYFAQAQAAVVGTSYSDGHLDPVNGMVVDHLINGTFSDGTLQMTVPLSDVGNPPMGTRLQYPFGVTEASTAGVPGVVTVLNNVVDSGTGPDFQLGHVCPPSH